mgnify:FL=1
MTKLLTIAIPAHNKSSYLNSALNSIINDDQFGENVNLVISDNSLNEDIENLYYKSFYDNKNIHYFKFKEFKCLDSNVNRSVEVSSGKYVWIFGDDDIIVPGILEKLISFLKEEKPFFTVLNSKSFREETIVEESRMPNNIESVYEEHDNDKFLSDMAGYLTYVGGICVRKDLWLENYDKSKIGSFFAHIQCLTSIKIGRKAHYFKYPSIQMRIGSQTWNAKSFLIWHKYYPELIWGLDNYSDSAKNKVICRNPINSLKAMMASRAYGRIDFNIFKNLILRSKKVNLGSKIFIFFLLFIPKTIFRIFYLVYILCFKNHHSINFSPKLALHNLRFQK